MAHSTVTKFDIDTCQTAMAFYNSRKAALMALQDTAQLTAVEFEDRLAEINSHIMHYGRILKNITSTPSKVAVHHG